MSRTILCLANDARQLRQTLAAQGIAAARAELLAPARIFGIAPGRESGSSVAYLVERSGSWNDRTEIAAEYLALKRMQACLH